MANIDNKALLQRFLDYVQVDSETGDEKLMAERLIKDLTELGLEVYTQDVHQAANTTGCNIYATLPSTSDKEPLMFCSHMDTVVPGIGVKPIICEDGYVRSDGTTVLGGDDKAGICAIMEAVKAVRDVPHRTVEVVFTVREESGLYGSKAVDYSRIQSKVGIILDSGGGPDEIITGAPGQNKITAKIIGKKSHAGVSPELGISAIQVAAHAVAKMNLLRIDDETTCNIGTFKAEGATNIVNDQVELVMEVRSRDTGKLAQQTDHMVNAMKEACDQFGATMECDVMTSYLGYKHQDDHPVVASIMEACRAIGLTPKTVNSGGGSDANVFNQNGIDACNMGVGMEKVHTTAEQLNIRHMEQASAVCLELMKA